MINNGHQDLNKSSLTPPDKGICFLAAYISLITMGY